MKTPSALFVIIHPPGRRPESLQARTAKKDYAPVTGGDATIDPSRVCVVLCCGCAPRVGSLQWIAAKEGVLSAPIDAFRVCVVLCASVACQGPQRSYSPPFSYNAYNHKSVFVRVLFSAAATDPRPPTYELYVRCSAGTYFWWPKA